MVERKSFIPIGQLLVDCIRPIEEKIMNDFGPYVANTHTETTESGTAMTLAYHKAKDIIKDHVNCQ